MRYPIFLCKNELFLSWFLCKSVLRIYRSRTMEGKCQNSTLIKIEKWQWIPLWYSDTGFSGTVVSQTYNSFHAGSLERTGLTVPLNSNKAKLFCESQSRIITFFHSLMLKYVYLFVTVDFADYFIFIIHKIRKSWVILLISIKISKNQHLTISFFLLI